ncbi:hypothetical protein ACFLS1_01780 [Verrucomicrobiota bacterium]
MKRLLLNLLIAGFVFSLVAGAVAANSKTQKKKTKKGSPTVEGTVKKEGASFWLVDDKGRKVSLPRKIGFGKNAVNTEDFLGEKVVATGRGTSTDKSLKGFTVTGLSKAGEGEGGATTLEGRLFVSVTHGDTYLCLVDDLGRKVYLTNRVKSGEEGVKLRDMAGARVIATGGGVDLSKDNIGKFMISSVKRVDEKEAQKALKIIFGTVTKDKQGLWLVDEKGRKIRLSSKTEVKQGKKMQKIEEFIDKQLMAIGKGDVSGASLTKFVLTGLYTMP